MLRTVSIFISLNIYFMTRQFDVKTTVTTNSFIPSTYILTNSAGTK